MRAGVEHHRCTGHARAERAGSDHRGAVFEVTAPVALEGLILAVSATLCPGTAGFAEEVSVIVVAARLTFWVSTDETLAE